MRLVSDVPVPERGQPFFEAWPEADEAAVARLMGELVDEAMHRGATHLHFDPDSEGTLVRARIAGALVRLRTLDPAAANALSRLIDARMRDAVAHGAPPLAVARLECRDGERVTLHLEAARRGAADLTALGMSRRQADGLVRALAAGRGLVLVAGPPGSGRSTTLRALLRRYMAPERALIAIEADGGAPLPGVARVAALPDDPAETLRLALALDPDAVMIDTIDDRETAMLACEAARSGKLVLAGVDAEDAVGGIMRLREWKVPPFGLALALSAAVAQRLVKRLCAECREPVQATGSVSALLGFDPGAVIHAPRGCPHCGGTGYSGKTGVFESAEVDEDLRRLICDGGDRAILASHAFLKAPNLGSSARAMVREGVTTAEEAVRISRTGAAALL